MSRVLVVTLGVTWLINIWGGGGAKRTLGIRNCNLHRSQEMGEDFFFLPRRNSPGGPRTPHYRGFTIAVRHATLGRTPLDE